MASTITERISFASTKNQLEYPDFLEIQLRSFQEFFQIETTPENRKNDAPGHFNKTGNRGNVK